MEQLDARLAGALQAAGRPLSSTELADLTDLDLRLVEHHLWGAPEQFVWQPGHRWASAPKKRTTFYSHSGEAPQDSRPFPFRPSGSTELRARTLANGLEVVISFRALDSLAFFSIRARGSTLEIILNSAHPLFADGALPFTGSDERMFPVLEAMFEAWAIIEDGAPAAERRMIEHLRHRWGERTLELLERQT